MIITRLFKHVAKAIVAGFITTYFEAITACFTISFASEVFTGRRDQQTYKKSHFNTEKCYLKLTGQFDWEKLR